MIRQLFEDEALRTRLGKRPQRPPYSTHGSITALTWRQFSKGYCFRNHDAQRVHWGRNYEVT